MTKEFIKRKLSREALDEFAKKYSDEQDTNVTHSMPYITSDGKTISFIPSYAILRGIPELRYFLGQTFPYQDRKKLDYPLTEIAFTKTKDGKKMPWSRNPKDITALIALATACRELQLVEKNHQLQFTVLDCVKAVEYDDEG